MRVRDLFLAAFGVAAVFLQLPITKIILDDPQALHLGVWNMQSFLLFSLFTFVVIPVCLGVGLVALLKFYPKTCWVTLAVGVSFIIATQVNVSYLKVHFPQAPWRQPLYAALVLLPIIPLIRFREPLIHLLKVSGLFGLGIFAYFAANAAPVRSAMPSSPVPAALQGGPPVFILTFEKLASSYLTDERGVLLKDHFPNLARFVRDADYYSQAYANSTATVYALRSLYTGRHWTSGRGWLNHPSVASILGPGRATHMLLDVLTEYCRPPATCVRTLAQEVTSAGVVGAYYKAYLSAILPSPIKVRLERATGMRGGFDRALDVFALETRSFADIGREQFASLTELVEAEGAAPALYIMHNFISQEPPALSSVIPGARHGQNPAVRLEELEATRKHLTPFDDALGEFLDQLKASGLYERSLIVVTSDTGYDPGFRAVSGQDELPVSPELMRIVLAIKRPGQRRGRVLSGPMHQVDVLPTILSHLGIDPAPFHFDGIPVTRPGAPRELAQRPVKFTITSARAGILSYLLSGPHGPLIRTERF